MLSEVAARLRRAIDERGWTIRILASKASVPDEVLWDFSQGRSWPDEAAAKRIALALGLNPHDLSPPSLPIFPAEETRTGREQPGRDGMGLPLLQGDPEDAVRSASSSWRQRELRRIEKRQDALIRLCISGGIFTQQEWEAKLSAIIRQRKGRRAGP